MDHTRRHCPALALVTAAAAVLAMVATAVVAVPAPAAIASTSGCAPVTVHVSTTGSGRSLRGYASTGAQTSSAPLTKDYGDIAFDGAGESLYGVTLDSAAALDTLDAGTGALLSSRLLTGAAAGVGDLNGLSGLPDGSLLAGTSRSGVLYRIDPATASSTVSALALPPGATSAGDFVTLDDGDVLALITEAPGATATSLARLHPDGTSTLVGRLPTTAYGLAQVSGAVDVAESTGDLVQLTAVPPNTPSTALLPTTTLASTGLAFSGATSVQDSGACNALSVSPSSSTYAPGAAVVLTASGLSATATGTVAFTAGVMPLCTVVLPSTSCTAGPLPPGTYTVLATASGSGRTGTTTFTVLAGPPLPAQTVTPTVPSMVPLGRRSVQATATSSGGGTISWTTSDPDVATIGPDGVLALHAAGSVTVTATAAATATTASGSGAAVLRVLDPPAPVLPPGTSRVSGPDRVTTSADVSSALFPDPPDDGSTDVVVTTSATYADAVAGARLAGLLGGPLLMTSPDHLDAATATEARRLAGVTGTVFVLGQQQAVSDGVEAALRAQSPGYAVRRIGGADRYQTAAAVAAAVTARSGDVGPIYVVTGRDFADGVCVTPYAGRTGGVVLLTDDALSPSTASYLAAHDPTGARTVAVGGAAGSALLAAGDHPSDVVAGDDRYGTSARLASRFASAAAASGAAAPVTSVGLAGGSSWSDALPGAAAMSHDDGPLLLTPSGAAQLPDATREALSALGPGVARAVVFGGSEPVPATVASQVAALIGSSASTVHVAAAVRRPSGASSSRPRPSTAVSRPAASAQPRVPTPTATPATTAPPAPKPSRAAGGASTSTTPSSPPPPAAQTWKPTVAPGVTGVVYAVMPHPDDEFEMWSQLQQTPSLYKVFVLLTHGEQSADCNADLPGYDPGYEPPPSPLPQGRWTPSCEAARLNSWLGYFKDVAATDASVPAHFTDRGEVGGFAAPPAGAVCRVDAQPGVCAHRDPGAHVWTDDGGHGELVVFDLGDRDVTPSGAAWAIGSVRDHRAQLGIDPALPSRGVLGAYYEEVTATGFSYPHPDHAALSAALYSTDLHLGPQMGAIAADDPRVRVRSVVDAQATAAAFGTGQVCTGAHPRWYGWLWHDPHDPVTGGLARCYQVDRTGQKRLFQQDQTFFRVFGQS